MDIMAFTPAIGGFYFFMTVICTAVAVFIIKGLRAPRLVELRSENSRLKMENQELNSKIHSITNSEEIDYSDFDDEIDSDDGIRDAYYMNAMIAETINAYKQDNEVQLAVVIIDLHKLKHEDDVFITKKDKRAFMFEDSKEDAQTIAEFIDRLKQFTRPVDVFCRLHGYNFAILMPNGTLEQAMLTADNLVKSVGEKPLIKSVKPSTEQPTLNIGITTFDPRDDARSLARRVWLSLIEAKCRKTEREDGHQIIVVLYDQDHQNSNPRRPADRKRKRPSGQIDAIRYTPPPPDSTNSDTETVH